MPWWLVTMSWIPATHHWRILTSDPFPLLAANRDLSGEAEDKTDPQRRIGSDGQLAKIPAHPKSYIENGSMAYWWLFKVSAGKHTDIAALMAIPGSCQW